MGLVHEIHGIRKMYARGRLWWCLVVFGGVWRCLAVFGGVWWWYSGVADITIYHIHCLRAYTHVHTHAHIHACTQHTHTHAYTTHTQTAFAS